MAAKYKIYDVTLSKNIAMPGESLIIRVDIITWDWLKKQMTWSNMKNRFKWGDLIG